VRKGALAPEKGTYPVILSAAKDLLPKANQQAEEILCSAQNDRLIHIPRRKPLSAKRYSLSLRERIKVRVAS
jgi:hypothetical protein